MTTEMSAEKATALRKPFPKESVGQLPKGGQMLDYVGHAAVTDRLLSVDPLWSWEPMALDQFGSPQCDRDGNLWIRLTICGVTRLGVGDGKNMKERVGDAIRNAAMRFGVALDLWAKENLVEFKQAVISHQRQAEVPPEPPPREPSPDSPPESGVLLDPKSNLGVAMYAGISNDPGITEAERVAWVGNVIGRDISSTKEMLESEAREVLAVLKERKKAATS